MAAYRSIWVGEESGMKLDQEKLYKALVAVKALSAVYLVYGIYSLHSALTVHGCRFLAVMK